LLSYFVTDTPTFWCSHAHWSFLNLRLNCLFLLNFSTLKLHLGGSVFFLLNPSTIHYLLFPIHFLLFIVHRLLFFSTFQRFNSSTFFPLHYLLFTVYNSPFTLFSTNHSYAFLIPSSRLVEYFHPSSFNKETSISLRGVPSGLVVSKTISPS